MKINEEEARSIYYAISNINDEVGENNAECPILIRIRRAFPKFDKEITQKEHRDYLWSHEVEADERVKAVRRKINERPQNSTKEEVWAYDDLINELDTTKKRVLTELINKELNGR
jgi:hypothetical protein